MGAFVLDASFARDPNMSAHLGRNALLISDWFIAESYKTGSLAGLQKNLEILSKHLKWTGRLKRSREIPSLQLYRGDPRIALVDPKQSGIFHDFVPRALAAKPGDDFDILIEEKRQAVDDQMNQLAQIFGPIGAHLDDFRTAWTAEGRALFLSNPKVVPKRLINTIVPMVHEICERAYRGSDWPSDRRHQMMMFNFRLILCMEICLLKRSFKGNAKGTAAEKFRNDLIDCSQMALGTYFNGFMTADKGAIWAGKFAMKILHQLGAMPQLPRRWPIGEYLHPEYQP